MDTCPRTPTISRLLEPRSSPSLVSLRLCSIRLTKSHRTEFTLCPLRSGNDGPSSRFHACEQISRPISYSSTRGSPQQSVQHAFLEGPFLCWSSSSIGVPDSSPEISVTASGCLDSSGGTLVNSLCKHPSLVWPTMRVVQGGCQVPKRMNQACDLQDAVCQRRSMAQSGQHQPADAVGKDIPQESSTCRVTVTSNLHPSQYTETYLPLHVLKIIRRQFFASASTYDPASSSSV